MLDENIVRAAREAVGADAMFVEDLVVGGWHVDGAGMLAVSEGPGLGIVLEAEAL